MPNLTGHMALAEEALTELEAPLFRRYQGAYLLGSTAPDIRIITKWPREKTHFAPLVSTGLTAGVEGLFAAHPQLLGGSGLNEPSVAFLAGYISHLVADQAWIERLYRPFFANPEVFQDRIEANIMDRALQLELDCQGQERLRQVRDTLALAERGVQVGFLEPVLLQEWRHWVEQASFREFSWERLRFMARRQYPNSDPVAQHLVEEFLTGVPEGLARIYRRLPDGCLAAFRETARRELALAVKRYLL
ncbi:MAG: zinc dependent phospholipase C family protein [Chloroflexi bacterium]|nr:zinc dependent phospholipase C family protein [Chloroflexota bacterium]